MASRKVWFPLSQMSQAHGKDCGTSEKASPIGRSIMWHWLTRNYFIGSCNKHRHCMYGFWGMAGRKLPASMSSVREAPMEADLTVTCAQMPREELQCRKWLLEAVTGTWWGKQAGNQSMGTEGAKATEADRQGFSNTCLGGTEEIWECTPLAPLSWSNHSNVWA